MNVSPRHVILHLLHYLPDAFLVNVIHLKSHESEGVLDGISYGVCSNAKFFDHLSLPIVNISETNVDDVTGHKARFEMSEGWQRIDILHQAKQKGKRLKKDETEDYEEGDRLELTMP
jgi:hypothetical protein